jgi:hypothetical protein
LLRRHRPRDVLYNTITTLEASTPELPFSLERGREVLGRTPDVLRSLLFGLSAEWTAARETACSWSPYEVVGHLLYTDESDWLDRTQIILDHGTTRTFEPVDREAGFSQYLHLGLDDILDRFAAVRAHNLTLLDELLQPGDLQRRGVHPEFGEVTLDQLLATWVVHDLNHQHQVVKTMAKQYTHAIGPWRQLLPIVHAP